MRAPWLCAALALTTAVACARKAPPPPGRRDPTPTEPAARAAPSDASSARAPAATEPPPPPPDLVPDADDPWLAWADGGVLVADVSGERPGREGEAVPPGALVAVDPGGRAEIDLPDGSVVDLDEATELLVHTVRREGDLRQVELAVLGGAVRVIAAPTAETGSLFRVTTPVGVAEVQGTVLAVEVDAVTGAARVVVLDGKVVVQTATSREVLSASGGVAAGLEMVAGDEIRPLESPADAADRWTAWTERQADALLESHGVDLAAPEVLAGTGLSPEAHPAWRASLELRRGRAVSRARALAAALGSEALAATVGTSERLAAGRAAFGAKVAAATPSAGDGDSRVRAERWAARAAQRAERRAALRDTLAVLRRAYEEHRAAPSPRGL